MMLLLVLPPPGRLCHRRISDRRGCVVGRWEAHALETHGQQSIGVGGADDIERHPRGRLQQGRGRPVGGGADADAGAVRLPSTSPASAPTRIEASRGPRPRPSPSCAP